MMEYPSPPLPDGIGTGKPFPCECADDRQSGRNPQPHKETWHGVRQSQFEKHLPARGITHAEKIQQVGVHTDEALSCVGDDGKKADDENDQDHRTQPAAEPHQDQRSDRHDRYGLKQDGVRKHTATDHGGLGQDKRDQDPRDPAE